MSSIHQTPPTTATPPPSSIHQTPASTATAPAGCIDPSTAAELVEGLLSRDRVVAVEAHIDHCSACRAYVSTLARGATAPVLDGLAEWTPPHDIEPPDEGAMPALGPGDKIDRYLIVGTVGRGGMGIVYAAYDPVLDRKIALKLLHVTSGTVAPDEMTAARLVREARAMAQLSHPNILTVHDVGVQGDQISIAMELINGRTLAAWMKERRHGWREVLRMMIPAARGLAAAHGSRIVHRDFKPQNVLIGDDGQVKVMDFGVASSLDPVTEPSAGEAGQPAAAHASATRTGTIVGTPAYMAPEQMAGQRADDRSDQYSFCVTLYEALYGARPFPGTTTTELAPAVTRGAVPDEPTGAGVPRWVRAIVLRGLRATAAERFTSMTELIAALERDPGRRRRRIALAAAGAGAIAALIVGARAMDAPRETTCQLGDERFATAWNAERRGAIATAFAATGRPYAAQTLVATAAALDGYGARWTAMYREACEATHVRGDQSSALMDLRMQCLDGRLRAVKALASVLEEPGAETVDNAVGAVLALPAIESCGDVKTLQAVVPLPDEPAVRAQVEAARADLSRARALLVAGRYSEAESIVTPTVELARRSGYRPVQAEVLIVAADIQLRLARIEPGLALLDEALIAAHAGGDDVNVANVLIGLMKTAGLDQRDAKEAERWHRLAEGAVERLRGDRALEAKLWLQYSRVLGINREYARAKDYAQHALDVYQRTATSTRTEVALAEEQLATVLHGEGAYVESERAYRRVLAVYRAELGTEHPYTIGALNNLANSRMRQGAHAEALRLVQQVVDLQARTQGADHPKVAMALNNLGTTYSQLGDLRNARQALERALAIYERAYGSEDPRVAEVLGNLALNRLDDGDPAAALAAARRAAEIDEARLGPEHYQLARTLSTLGRAEREHGDFAASLATYQRAIAILERDPSRRMHPSTAAALTGAALAQLALRRPTRAVPLFERALMIRDALAKSPMQIAQAASTRFDLARAMWDAGSARPRAAELARQARTEMASVGEIGRDDLRYFDPWLRERGIR